MKLKVVKPFIDRESGTVKPAGAVIEAADERAAVLIAAKVAEPAEPEKPVKKTAKKATKKKARKEG